MRIFPTGARLTVAPLLLCPVLAVAAAASGAQSAAAAPVVETVASYPSGAFLENLTVGRAGDLMFTSYMDRTIYRWTGAGQPAAFARLDAHPVGILVHGGNIIVSAHGASFTGGPAFTSTNRILILSPTGAVRRIVPAPNARFLNGLVALSPRVVLAADSLAGRIWALDTRTGALTAWLADPRLAPDPAQTEQRPGANGLKVRNGALYISNSSRGEIYRVPLDGVRPGGAMEVAHRPGPVDDFAFLGDGSIVAATHGSKLLRITPDGRVGDLMSDGCDACTSIAEYGPSRDLIVLTTGGLLEGSRNPARVLRLPSPTAHRR